MSSTSSVSACVSMISSLVPSTKTRCLDHQDPARRCHGQQAPGHSNLPCRRSRFISHSIDVTRRSVDMTEPARHSEAADDRELELGHRTCPLGGECHCCDRLPREDDLSRVSPDSRERRGWCPAFEYFHSPARSCARSSAANRGCTIGHSSHAVAIVFGVLRGRTTRIVGATATVHARSSGLTTPWSSRRAAAGLVLARHVEVGRRPDATTTGADQAAAASVPAATIPVRTDHRARAASRALLPDPRRFGERFALWLPRVGERPEHFGDQRATVGSKQGRVRNSASATLTLLRRARPLVRSRALRCRARFEEQAHGGRDSGAAADRVRRLFGPATAPAVSKLGSTSVAWIDGARNPQVQLTATIQPSPTVFAKDRLRRLGNCRGHNNPSTQLPVDRRNPTSRSFHVRSAFVMAPGSARWELPPSPRSPPSAPSA